MPVLVRGVAELRKALAKYAPELKKEMDAEIRTALKEVRDAARAKVPGTVPGNLYNWAKADTDRAKFPRYDASIIKSGIVYSMAQSRANAAGFKSLYYLANKSPVGAIVETAGRVNPYGRPQIAARKYGQSSKGFGKSNNPDAGRRFVGAMNGVGALKQYDSNQKHRGRLIYAAYDENQGKALDATMKAIANAERKFNQLSRLKNQRAAAYGAVA